MSDRRQQARRDQQEKRRQERRNQRIEQRRQAATTRPAGGSAPGSAAAGSGAGLRTGSARRATRPNRRPLWIAAGIAGGLLLVVIVIFLFRSQTSALPGQYFDTNGNEHVQIGEAHGAYYSNPPTSGWHTEQVPRPGIYSQPVRPEDQGHFLEHGGIWVLYTCPNGCDDLAKQLADIVNKQIDRNHPVALAPYPPAGVTPPEHMINVTAWQYMLSLDSLDADKINEFIDRQTCRYNPEGGPYCTGVKGSTKAAPKDAGPGGYNAVTATATPAPGAITTPPAVGPAPAVTVTATATPAR